MTTNQARDVPAAAIDEAAVAQYLLQNPDFFERHTQLLARLRLQHPRDATTVSLIERQVEVLREKHQAQEQKLAEFVKVARANNQLADRIHRFACRLLRATTRTDTLMQIEASLREDFDVFQAVLVLGSGTRPEELAPQRFVRSVAPDDPMLLSFENLFASCRPRCGQVRDSQREFLFGSDAAAISSVALVPLGGEPPLGLLALGSGDAERYHPGMSTEFLARIGELATEALTHR